MKQITEAISQHLTNNGVPCVYYPASELIVVEQPYTRPNIGLIRRYNDRLNITFCTDGRHNPITNSNSIIIPIQDPDLLDKVLLTCQQQISILQKMTSSTPSPTTSGPEDPVNSTASS